MSDHNPLHKVLPPQRTVYWLAAALTFALLAMLFPTPQPAVVSTQFWRAELLTALVLFGCIGSAYWHDRSSIARMFMPPGRTSRLIVASLAAFTLWGMVSALWAPSPYSAWHHTLVWAAYLLFLLFTLELLRSAGSVRFVTATFISIAAVIGLLCIIDYVMLPNFDVLEGTLRSRYAKYAELLVTLLPIVWVSGVYASSRSRYILITTAAALGWIAVMLSLSKGALIAGGVGIGVMFAASIIFGQRGLRRRLVVSMAVWLMMTAVIQIAMPAMTSIPSTKNYLSGETGAIRESSLSRLFVWSVAGEMLAGHWITGVGADNFGISFNAARARYREKYPDDPPDELVSHGLVQRAHNEPLQVAAELGMIGAGLLLVAFAVFAASLISVLAKKLGRMCPMFFAAAGGLVAFTASSMVSSFSLRLVQNGIVFFLVLAVALHEMRKSNGSQMMMRRQSPSPANFSTPLFAATSVLMIVMIATHGLKAAAEYAVLSADHEPDAETANSLYARALTLDPDYAGAYLRRSGRSYVRNDLPAAAADLEKAIDHGLGIVVTYSSLASCYIKTGDTASADRTFGEAISIFPRSTFLRVKYAIFLEDIGRSSESGSQMAKAYEIDRSQAAGWRNIIKDGSVAAYYAARSDPDIAAPEKLSPEAAVYEYLDDPPSER